MAFPQLIDEFDALSLVLLLVFLFQLVLGNKTVEVVLVFLPYLWEENTKVLHLSKRTYNVSMARDRIES